MALSLIMIGADVASVAIAIDSLKKESPPGFSVQLGVGRSFGSENTCNDCDGDVPFVHVWDTFGEGYGQASSKGKIHPGTTKTVSIPKSPEMDNDSAQPEYVMLTMGGDDAVCLTHVIATGNSAQWTWFGDMGAKCGADWYPSDYKIGAGTYTPKCVWLDKNHSKDLRFASLGLHMPDFAGDEPGKVKEYQKDPDTLCKSTRRMGFFPKMPINGLPPFFIPPLNYTEDGADVDFKYVKDKPRSRVRRWDESNHSLLQKRGTSNPQPGRLIVSGHVEHSGTELCESETSYGPDFVSTVDNTYCDMSAKKAWPLCDKNGVKENCFDLANRAMRGSIGGKSRRDQIPPEGKRYTTTEIWGGVVL